MAIRADSISGVVIPGGGWIESGAGGDGNVRVFLGQPSYRAWV